MFDTRPAYAHFASNIQVNYHQGIIFVVVGKANMVVTQDAQALAGN